MIIVQGRNMCIPPAEKKLGFVGDNLVESRVFEIKDASLFGMEFRADIDNTHETVYLEKQMMHDGSTLHLKWDITSAAVRNAGILTFQLRAFETDSDKVWHSEKDFFYVEDSVDVEGDMTEKEISEFSAIEKNVTLMHEQAREYAESAKNSAEKAKENSELAHTHSAYDITENQDRQFVTQNDKQRWNGVCEHTENKTNPHNVTPSQIGAYTKNEIDGMFGDMDTALDAILSLQEHYIGGGV